MFSFEKWLLTIYVVDVVRPNLAVVGLLPSKRQFISYAVRKSLRFGKPVTNDNINSAVLLLLAGRPPLKLIKSPPRHSWPQNIRGVAAYTHIYMQKR